MITDQALRIAGVVRSPQLQYALAEAVAPCDRLDVRVGDLKSLAPDLVSRAPAPGVLLLDVDVDDAEDTDALERLSAEATRAHVPIVATAGDLSAATVRRLLRHGVADCLIDLDLQFGTVALQLDLHPAGGLFDLAQARECLDEELFSSSLLEHRSGLRMLAGPSAAMALDALR